MWVQTLSDSCLDLLFPPRCAICNGYLKVHGGKGICLACKGRVLPVEEPVCTSCGMEVYAKGSVTRVCGDCLRNIPPFEFARSLFRYGDEIRVLVARLKYNKDTSVTAAIVDLVRECDLSLFNSCNYIVPVPLHKKRLQLRGFNQALLLAKICFGRNDARIHSTLLRRTRNTAPQVSLSGIERRRSLRNVFKVDTAIDISSSTVCLVDDVYTTGTTVSECAKGLLRGGAGRVVVLTLARAEVPRRGRN